MDLAITIQTPEVPVPVPIALCSGTLKEKISKIADWGGQGVEFLTTNPQDLDQGQISALLESQGLKAAAVASGGMGFALGLTLLHADSQKAAQARQRLYDLIELAGALHAPVVTIGSFRGRLANAKGLDGQAILRETLREAADVAAEKSVRLAIEPLNRYETDFFYNVEQGLEFVNEVNHPAVGLLLDTYHVNIEESSWTAPFRMAAEAGKLFHVHLGDNNRLAPGQGLIDFAAIVKVLSETGYLGFLSAELLAKPDPDTAARQTLEYMRALLGLSSPS